MVKNYEIIEFLGQGGFGITYKAIDAQTMSMVCIKEFFVKGLSKRQGKGINLQENSGFLRMNSLYFEDISFGKQRYCEMLSIRTLSILSILSKTKMSMAVVYF